MEDKKKKCSNEEHKDIDAISYCQDCKMYICNNVQIYIKDYSRIIKLIIWTIIKEYSLIYVKKKIIRCNCNFIVKIIINYVVQVV